MIFVYVCTDQKRDPNGTTFFLFFGYSILGLERRERHPITSLINVIGRKASRSVRKKVVRRATATCRGLASLPVTPLVVRGVGSSPTARLVRWWLPLLPSPTPPSSTAVCKRPHMFPRVPVSQRHSRVTVRVDSRNDNCSDRRKEGKGKRNEGHYRGTRVVYNIYICLSIYIYVYRYTRVQ